MRSVCNYNSFLMKFLLKPKTVGDRAAEGACPPPLPCRLITAWVCSYVREEERPLGKEKSFSCSWRSGERRRLLVLVPLHVESQMVGAGEAPAAG